jgi:cysteine desulfurase
MKKIYFDNAATTQLDKEVLEAMLLYMTDQYGNPSSVYSYGREGRLAIENARRSVAKNLGAKPSEIFFTSGGTESNNTAILSAIRDLNCTHMITSPIEHHSVLHTVEHYHHWLKTGLSFVKILPDGEIDYDSLEALLKNKTAEGNKCLVTLMHANNEIGNILDIKRVGDLCRQYAAVFHSDCVQTVGHYPIDLQNLNVDFISGSSHKFHGPKGAGVLYVKEGNKIKPLIHGGRQEQNIRAGTENVYGIVGFAKALERAMENFERDSGYIKELKETLSLQLKNIEGIEFNGSMFNSLYTVLKVSLPKNERTEYLLFDLDKKGILVSGGSACTGSASSHVIRTLNRDKDQIAIRFSFSRYNAKQEIDEVVTVVKACMQDESTEAGFNG